MLAAIGQGVINKLVFAMVVLFEREAYFLISFWLMVLRSTFSSSFCTSSQFMSSSKSEHFLTLVGGCSSLEFW
jgi:hypothetical protein